MIAPLDAVILAGGQSARLRGIVPPYHKPFIVIGGESLVVGAVRHARRQDARRIIVVTCSQIAEPLAQLLDTLPEGTHSRLKLVTCVDGVGPALVHGAGYADENRLLVLMADNLHIDRQVDALCRHPYAVGTRVVSTPDARRFTRFVRSRWVEDDVTHSEEPFTEVWCGPLLVDRRCVVAAARRLDKIGPNLARLVPAPGDLHRVPVDSLDVGTPEELRRLTGGQQ